jgi:hypothetical protein
VWAIWLQASSWFACQIRQASLSASVPLAPIRKPSTLSRSSTASTTSSQRLSEKAEKSEPNASRNFEVAKASLCWPS